MGASIEIAKPVLSLTYKRNHFITDSIFVLEEFPGVSLNTYLMSNGDLAKRAEVIRQIVWIWSKMINYHFLHLDPVSNNILVDERNGAVQVGLIDLDSIRAVSAVQPLKLLLSRHIVRLKGKLFRVLSEDDIVLFFEELARNCTAAIRLETLWEIYKTPSVQTFRHIIRS